MRPRHLPEARDRADFKGASVTNLSVLGQPVTVTPNARIALGDWGHAYVLEEEQIGGKSARAPTYHAWVTGIDIWIDASHGSLPAGTRILIGYADALASIPPPQSFTPPPPSAQPAPSPPSAPEPVPPATVPATPSNVLNDLGLFPVLSIPPPLQRSITSQGYVFPVYGPSGYGDTFGAPRGDVPGGWHHGDDIFAPLGAPLLAVADGVVFSVGPNRIGGNRLWLQDEAGNQYYYAHLSAYTPLARNGTHVHAGDVLGFVGNTGDAAGGPYHLHFEVHPASLLFLGYDGAVDPTPYLDAWRHLQDVRFPAGVAWAPQPLHSLAAASRRVPRPEQRHLDRERARPGDAPARDRAACERRAPLGGHGARSAAERDETLARGQADEPFGDAGCTASPEFVTLPLTQRRVGRPVNGLKKIPIATPVASRATLRKPCDFGCSRSWIRSAAWRSSPIARRRLA